MSPLLGHLDEKTGPSPERDAYVTGTVAGQLFGVPIGRVHDVFTLGELTPVPLAPPDVLGLTNLRGRVLTAVDIRPRLGLEPKTPEPGMMAIGIEAGPNSFGLVVDRIGEIIEADRSAFGDNPVHLDPAWAGLARGVHRLEHELLVVLSVDAMLDHASTNPNLSRAPESPQ